MKALRFNCPSCGAEIVFQCSISVYAVCAFCGSTVVRHDLNLDLLGKVATVDDSWTPLQLGVSGKYLGTSFSVLGRIKREWSEGSWNEWFLLFTDGSSGWLSEAQGFYFVSKSFSGKSIDLDNRHPANLAIGDIVDIANVSFALVDRKEASTVFFEGELPFAIALGSTALCLDFATTSDRFATIELPHVSSIEGSTDTDGFTRLSSSVSHANVANDLSVFTGHIVDFNDLSFRDLREIDGWKIPSRLS